MTLTLLQAQMQMQLQAMTVSREGACLMTCTLGQSGQLMQCRRQGRSAHLVTQRRWAHGADGGLSSWLRPPG